MTTDKPVVPRRSAGAVRSEASHLAILSAAKALLQEKGYAGFSIEGVARLAGASKPTLYRWWPNRAQLIAEVYESEAKNIIISNDYPARKRFEILLNTLWELWDTTICGVAFRSFIAESQYVKENMDMLRDEFMTRRLELPRSILIQGVERGELSESTDVELMLRMTFGFCWIHMLTDNLSDRSIIESFVNHLFQCPPKIKS